MSSQRKYTEEEIKDLRNLFPEWEERDRKRYEASSTESLKFHNKYDTAWERNTNLTIGLNVMGWEFGEDDLTNMCWWIPLADGETRRLFWGDWNPSTDNKDALSALLKMGLPWTIDYKDNIKQQKHFVVKIHIAGHCAFGEGGELCVAVSRAVLTGIELRKELHV